MLAALIPAARRADRNSRPRGGSKNILGPHRGFSGANVQCSYCAHAYPGGTIRECFHMRSDLRRGSPFPDILEELPVEKRSLTQNQYSYLKPHVCCSIGKLKLLRIRERFPPYSDRARVPGKTRICPAFAALIFYTLRSPAFEAFWIHKLVCLLVLHLITL